MDFQGLLSIIGRSCQDDNIKSVNKTKVCGTRFIVLHAGNRHGFIPGAELVSSSKTLDSDYHGEMNQENFKHWFEHQLLLNLEKPSTIILDNVSYHKTILNKAPTTANKKVEIQGWLISNNIAYEESDL
ncbi:hypothetical protein HHI36_008759 [Cryptolaemus montrouzieri]|uniref:Transposase n=1 Tax=Cryptolaemus montrouzieri TaxID=559131 RepID=A0ABD2MTH3_9CUCU